MICEVSVTLLGTTLIILSKMLWHELAYASGDAMLEGHKVTINTNINNARDVGVVILELD